MKVIKNINNNVSICEDNDGNEVIAFGRGIGFKQPPYEIEDLSLIKRTYYGINPELFGLLNEIPEDIFEISSSIVDEIKMKIDYEINPNIVFTLADHISFAIQRYEKNIDMKMPFAHDLQHLYATEYDIGLQAVKYINKKLNVYLNYEEASSIALHIINAENIQSEDKEAKVSEKNIIEDLSKIIEKDFNIKIDKNSFNYSRFISHMQYLLKRKDENNEIRSENKNLYNSMKQEFPQTYNCVMHFKEYIRGKLEWNPNDEELLYLMLHINRLCAREDCYQ